MQTRDPRVVVGLDGRRNHTVEATDVDRITCRNGRLNGFAINGLAASFQSVFGHPTVPQAARANECAVLTTYDLHRVRYKASDATLWRNLSHTKYWDKPLWLIPIHRAAEEHWVFVAVSVRDQRLFLFDSLAQRRGWRQDIQVCSRLLTF